MLRGWVEAYFKAVETLSRVLGVREELFEWDELSVEYLRSFVNNLAWYVIGGLVATPLMGAASLALISVLTYMAFKKEGEGYLKEIIGLRRSLEGLLVKGPDGRLDFNELGRLLVYRVAYAMGMSYEEAKEALMDIAGLSMDELERRVNEIERRIKELEEKVNELNNWINLLKQKPTANIIIAGKADFEQGIIYPNIKVENGELRIRVEDEYHSIVKAGKFNELISDVKGRLMGNGIVVVVGPKGIGKSTLAAAVIWELLMNGDIGLVARVDVLDSENSSEFATFVENYGKEFSKYFGKLLILYDPVSTKAYEKVGVDVKAPIQTSIEKTVNNLMNVVNAVSSEASKPLTLIVIPSDIYNALSNDMRAKLESHSLDVSQGLINTEFLAELIREYSKTKDKPNGCSLSDDVLNKLADEVAGFDSSHALIARLIGEELARNNCDVGKIEELINNAKGKAEKFIILHINGLFKVDEDPDTAKALVEIFALRKPFVNEVGPGDPILTQGIVGLIGEVRGTKVLYGVQGGELRSWLTRRQHDLIEDSIGGLLKCIVSEGEECKKFDDELLKPWMDVHVPRIRSKTDAVKYFARKYGKRLIKRMRRHKNCWKRAALIIGYASAGRPIVPRPEDLHEDVMESIKGALDRCGVDYYLLVGDVIPPLIRGLAYTRALTEAFIDKYNEAVAEVRRILNIARGRGISVAERLYGLGLALIIAKAVELNKDVESGGTDAALHIASFAIKGVILPILIRPILDALVPLRGKTPHRYIVLLALASDMENLDSDTVGHIFKELNEILGSYGDVVKEHAPSLVDAIIAYANLLSRYPVYFSDEEVKDMVGRVANLLNELGRFKTSLGVIAWAYALVPALMHGGVRVLMERALHIDVVDKANNNKANEILVKLNDMRERVQELISDEEFMGYVESKSVKADEEVVKKVILETASRLKYALAIYRRNNDELYEAARLFNEAAKEYRETGAYENYLVVCSWALRTEAIRGSLLVDEFGRLYEEAFDEEHFEPTAPYLSIALTTLGDYLVSLALAGNYEMISKLLEEHWWVLNANYEVSVLTRLTLNALLGHRVELSGKLKGRLSVNPEELINAFESRMHNEFRPALRVALEIAKPEDGIKSCEKFNDEDCVDFVLAVKGNSAAVKQLRDRLIDGFHEQISKKEVLDLLKGLGVDDDKLLNMFDVFKSLVYGLDGKSLVQLIAPRDSIARLALMLRALINGDEELAKAHALMGAVYTTVKLSTRLFLEAYDACCDLKSESFRRAIASLFFLHV